MTGPTPRRNTRVIVRSGDWLLEEHWCTPRQAEALLREWRRARDLTWTVETWERVAVRWVRRRR